MDFQILAYVSEEAGSVEVILLRIVVAHAQGLRLTENMTREDQLDTEKRCRAALPR